MYRDENPGDFLRVVVPMKAFGKARPRVTKTGHTYMPDDYEANRQALQWYLNGCYVEMPAKVTVVAVRRMPKSWSLKKKEAMAGRYANPSPDVDNIIGAVMDALFPDDDSKIVDCEARKVWGWVNCLDITVERVDPEEEIADANFYRKAIREP